MIDRAVLQYYFATTRATKPSTVNSPHSVFSLLLARLLLAIPSFPVQTDKFPESIHPKTLLRYR